MYLFVDLEKSKAIDTFYLFFFFYNLLRNCFLGSIFEIQME